MKKSDPIGNPKVTKVIYTEKGGEKKGADWFLCPYSIGC